MARHWTFTQKVSAAFAVTVLLAALLAVVAIFTLQRVVASKDRVIDVNAHLLIDAQALRAAFERKVATSRGFLLNRDEGSLDRMREARAEFVSLLERLAQLAITAEGQRQIEAIGRDEAEHEEANQRVLALRRQDASLELIQRTSDEQVGPLRDQLYLDIRSFIDLEERLLTDARDSATATATRAIRFLVALGGCVLAFAVLVAILLARTLNRQVGAAVGQVQSSSAELQATANQQASGAAEQASAMREISTTINELLASSRQIALSAQRVAQLAEATAAAAREGDTTVVRTHESIAAMRRQVELVVGHMLELGGRSQQIGAVVEIVAELAEQTNILAINATIEAAGAGEAGKRFAVVADEIRKLADRVAGSTKEIRALVEDVRSAVHTTVMATETGSKAVEAGSQQFGDVATAFKRIGGLVVTSTEVAREIELSTQQQSTAVEQINVAVTNVAQASREAEVSTGQTLQTASQLAELSADLQRLVQPRAAA